MANNNPIRTSITDNAVSTLTRHISQRSKPKSIDEIIKDEQSSQDISQVTIGIIRKLADKDKLSPDKKTREKAQKTLGFFDRMDLVTNKYDKNQPEYASAINEIAEDIRRETHREKAQEAQESCDKMDLTMDAYNKSQPDNAIAMDILAAKEYNATTPCKLKSIDLTKLCGENTQTLPQNENKKPSFRDIIKGNLSLQAVSKNENKKPSFLGIIKGDLNPHTLSKNKAKSRRFNLMATSIKNQSNSSKNNDDIENDNF